MEQLFTNLSHAVEGAPLIALTASVVWGILSIILSPCHLASIPLIVGFISEQGQVTATARILDFNAICRRHPHHHRGHWRNHRGGGAHDG